MFDLMMVILIAVLGAYLIVAHSRANKVAKELAKAQKALQAIERDLQERIKDSFSQAFGYNQKFFNETLPSGELPGERFARISVELGFRDNRSIVEVILVPLNASYEHIRVFLVTIDFHAEQQFHFEPKSGKSFSVSMVFFDQAMQRAEKYLSTFTASDIFRKRQLEHDRPAMIA